MSATLTWAAEAFAGCGIAVYRSPIRLMSSTTPVLSMRAPAHPSLKLPLPGQTPYCLVLTLNPYTLATLTLGDFDGAFVNHPITAQEAAGFNQQYVAQFAFFDTIRHLIADREGIIPAMTWAPFDLLEEDDRRVVFRRRRNGH
jgi:hypothetical protein